MIYPQATAAGPGGSAGKRGGKNSSLVEKKAVARKNGKGGKPQQLVQWKQKNVEEGIVVVDEQQLSKLIKREPIEKYYKLDPEPFASGLFASVRRCVSRETGEPYAAKFSSRARYGDDCSAEIHHEIALLSLCAPSPRIVKLHDVFETATEIIILMQFAPGGDLQTVIDDNLVPFEADVVNFIRQLVEGLAYLHERKIAHLDIKPQNLVMMGDFPNCDIKLCDFEISRVILEGTEIREILGTPDYVAPEILHYEPITLSADLWSLGVTTYVLLTGFSPFGGETDQETFCNISRAILDFPEELFEDVSEDAKDFIQQLLVRDPSARPTAKALLRHRWLSQKRRASAPTVESSKVAAVPDPSDREKNLRKYLSKSREALFERVVQQQNQQKNDLRKTTLLSQYNKTRMCESHMSLVSKTREDRPLFNLSPSFSRSREKLYGLRSLSRSHEGLDLLKLSGKRSESQGSLKAYARATTADLSMLPLLRLKEKLNESNDSVNSKGTVEDIEITTKLNGITDGTSEKSKIEEKTFRKNKSDTSIMIPTLISPALLRNTIENCSKLANTMLNNDKTNLSQNGVHNSTEKLPGNEMPYVSSLTLDRGETKIEIPKDFSKGPLKEIVNKNLKDRIKSVKNEDVTDNNLNNICQKDNEVTIKKVEKDDVQKCDIAAKEVDEEKSTPKTIVQDKSKVDEEDVDEPTFTVAQLISAYNKHQEIVTKTSLEVTMTASDKSTKLPPPIIPEDLSTKFPTGPTALRLFIPDIDIETTKKKKNKTKSYRTLARSSTQCSIGSTSTDEMASLENDLNSTVVYDQESVIDNTESLALSNVDDTNNNIKTVNKEDYQQTCDEVETEKGDNLESDLPSCDKVEKQNISYIVLTPPSCERIEKQNGVPLHIKHSSIDITPNFLRSASLSSETSGGLTPSEASSSMSWDEVNVIPLQENQIEDSQDCKPSNKNVTTAEGRNPWGKLCTGSYTRAMEKFGGKPEIVPEIKTTVPTRKCSLSMLLPGKPELDEKVRRKSTSIMKLS